MGESGPRTSSRLVALVLLVLGVLLLKGGEALYALGSGALSDLSLAGLWRSLFDWEGWWEFTGSPRGLVLRGGGVLALALALLLVRRSGRMGKGEPDPR